MVSCSLILLMEGIICGVGEMGVGTGVFVDSMMV